MSYKQETNNFYPYIVISLSAFVVMSFSGIIGLFGDDYSWMLQAKNYDGNLFDHLFSAAPYGYFRPVVKLFFLIWHGIFSDNALPYRVFILILHIGCSLMVYNVFLKADYSRNVSWVGAVIFAVITCHSEALYSINSISEIFSAFFILSGIYFLLSDKKYFAILFFTLALFSRESALCFLPIALVFLYRKKVKVISLDNAVILLAPLLFYFSAYLISHNSFEFVRYGPQDIFTLNPLSMGYKGIHYFVNMILPTKTILFVLMMLESIFPNLFGWTNADGGIKELLVNAVKDPSSNLLIIASIAVIGILFFWVGLLLIRKSLKVKELLFPIVLSFAALIIYIPMIPTAERFLYLPSIGICLLLALIWNSLEKKKTDYGIIFLIVVISIYLISMGERAFYWERSTHSTIHTIEQLHKAIKDEKNDNILILDYDRKNYVNDYTLPDMYEYYYEKRKTFRFDELKLGEDREDFVKIKYNFLTFFKESP